MFYVHVNLKPMETEESIKSEKIEPSSQMSTANTTPIPTLAASSTSNITPAAAAAAAATTTTTTKTKLPSIVLPEVDLYLSLLVLLFAIDRQKHKQVFIKFDNLYFLFWYNLLFSEKALELAERMMEKIVNQNRRSLDVIAAKCYFYYGRINELSGRLDQIRL